MDLSYLYFLLLLASLFIPLLRSFDSRVAYYRSFRALFRAIFIVAVPFVIWDAIFTHLGVWGFSPNYISGISLLGLPLEEILFFVVIPYCGMFVYRVLNYFWPQSLFDRAAPQISNFLFGLSLTLALVFSQRLYPVFTFSFLAAFIFLFTRILNSNWLGRFYRMYLVLSLPFMLVNGVLTGTGISGEIVWYNSQEFSGIRLGSIPLEDYFYGMLLMLCVTALYEFFTHSKQMRQAG